MRQGKWYRTVQVANGLLLMWCFLVGTGCESYDGALMQAIRNEEVGNVKRLLDGGANAKIVPPEEQVFPLEAAAYGGNAEIVQLLLAHGAHPDSARGQFMPLAIAIQNDHPKAAELLVEAGANLNPYMRYDAGAFYCAVMLGFRDLARKMLDKGADVFSPGTLGSPLHEAADNDDTTMAQLLLTAGADLDRINQYGDTPLLVAAERKHWTSMRWLVAHGARVDVANNLKQTPLHRFATFDDTVAIREFCAIHPNPDQQNAIGETAMHAAAKYGNVAAILALVQHCGADLNIRDHSGLSPAGIAYREGQLEAVDLLTSIGGRLR